MQSSINLKTINKYCSYEYLSYFLENKKDMKEEEKNIYKNLMDNDLECWKLWNRVRWDVAMPSKGVSELREYLSDNFVEYYDSSWALAEEWNKKRRDYREAIIDFYKNTNNYIYNSLIFFESGDRINFHSAFNFLKEKFSVKSVTDYGCCIGNDGLAMLEEGMSVNFVDFNSPSIKFLKWRLQNRNISRDKYKILDVEKEFINNTDMFWCVDVLEHMVNPNDIFNFIGDSTRVLAFYIDADDEAGGRHPFHFKFAEKQLEPEFSKRGYRKVDHELLSLWIK